MGKVVFNMMMSLDGFSEMVSACSTIWTSSQSNWTAYARYGPPVPSTLDTAW